MEKPRQRGRSKDLLQLENSCAQSALKERLEICNANENLAFPVKSGSKVSKRTPIEAIPVSSVLERVKSFLPAMDEANRKLKVKVQENGSEAFDIEVLSQGDNLPYIQMDLALGVADLYTPDAVVTAEQVVHCQSLNGKSSRLFEDTNNSDSEGNNRGKEDKRCIRDQESKLHNGVSNPSGSSNKRQKIIEL